jgi:hypothetical protein
VGRSCHGHTPARAAFRRTSPALPLAPQLPFLPVDLTHPGNLQQGQEPFQDPWWHSDLDRKRFASDLATGHTALSSTEKALARVAHGLVAGRGEIEYQALFSAGYLDDVLSIIQRCTRTI